MNKLDYLILDADAEENLFVVNVDDPLIITGFIYTGMAAQ